MRHYDTTQVRKLSFREVKESAPCVHIQERDELEFDTRSVIQARKSLGQDNGFLTPSLCDSASFN